MLSSPQPPFFLPPNVTALWRCHHHELPPPCVAVGLFGLPRTLSRPKLATAWRDHLLRPLAPCVDTYLGFGFGEQRGIMQAGKSTCQSCVQPNRTISPWRPFLPALEALRPVAALHTFDSRRSAKQGLCVGAMAKVEAAASANYDFVLLARPDILLSRDFPREILRHDTQRFRFHDFAFLVPHRPAAYQAGWPLGLVGMVSGSSRDRRPWQRMALLGGRVCREDEAWAMQREALDEMWQSLGGDRLDGELLSTLPRKHALELLHRAAGVFCLRYPAVVRASQWAGVGALDGTTMDQTMDTTRGSCARDEPGHLVRLHQLLQPTMGMHASADDAAHADDAHAPRATAPAAPPPSASSISQSIRSTAAMLVDTGIRASYGSAANHSAAVRSLMCSCAQWAHVQRWPPPELNASAAKLSAAYDHHHLECSENVSVPEAVGVRHAYRVAAVARLDAAIHLVDDLVDAASRSAETRGAHEGKHMPIGEPSVHRACASACHLYTELAIMCDVSRYQYDLLPAVGKNDDTAGHEPGRDGTRYVPTLRRLGTLAAALAAAAPAGCVCSHALTHQLRDVGRTSSARASVGGASIPASSIGVQAAGEEAVATFERACEGMGLVDVFRLAVDTAPIARAAFLVAPSNTTA